MFKADEIHDYFIKLEEVYHEILDEESNELRNQICQKETQLIEDKQQILLSSYHKKCIDYLVKIAKNKWKFGNTDNVKRRLNEHRREIGENVTLIFCIESKNNVLLEQKLKDYLRTTNYRREEVINGKLQTELIEIDDISIIQDKLIELNETLEDQSQLILELRLEISQLKEELNKYKNGEIKDQVFLKETYKHFFENHLSESPNSKVELKVVLQELEKYIKQNNIKFINTSMFSEDRNNFLSSFHGYSIKCKTELLKYIKEIFPNSVYKHSHVKRQRYIIKRLYNTL